MIGLIILISWSENQKIIKNGIKEQHYKWQGKGNAKT